MAKIKKFDDLYIDTRDFWSAVKNLVHLGIIPYSEEEKELNEKIGYLINWIAHAVEYLWVSFDIKFTKNTVEISDDTNKVFINLDEGSLIFNGDTIYIPYVKLKYLYDWVYQVRQDKMTLPGIHIQKFRER